MSLIITSLLDSLSLREKIGQTCQMPATPLAGKSPPELRSWFEQFPVGSIFVGGEVIQSSADRVPELKALIDACQLASRVPLSVSGDLENGAGGAVPGLTAFPNLMALGAVSDPAEAYAYGYWTAVEARTAGFNWTFGPVVDLARNWLNPIVNIRALGRHPQPVAARAVELIRGLQENGLSATAKHFPGDGVDFRDQHLCVAVNALTEENWRATFGAVFRASIDAGVHAIMAGHIALPWCDPRTGRGGRPIPATVSRPILTTLLREDLGYEGVLVSDALIMAGFTGWAAYEERLLQAFEAGTDVMLWPGERYFAIMERALNTGRISPARLDESVQRILVMKQKQGLLGATSAGPGASLRHASAGEFGRDLAAKSITLVRNQLELLPLTPAACRKVIVQLATPRPERGPKRIEPFLQRLRQRGIEVTLLVNGNCLDIQKREEAGERYDALLAIFDIWTHALKNTMRPSGEMAECLWTLQMVETMQPILISLGSPFLLNDMPWAETCINAYGADRFTLEALDRVLFGELPFTGVSPVPVGGDWVLKGNELKEPCDIT